MLFLTSRFGISTLITSGLLLLFSGTAYGAVSSWQKGASIVPNGPEDFGTENMKASLRQLKDTNANYVSLIVPYYQSNIYSTDIARGWNTPSDAALIEATDYAHSLGLKVMLKFHPETRDGNWRAYINPWSRDEWFDKYTDILHHYGEMAEAHGVESIAIGAELITLTSPNANPTNSAHWNALIEDLKSVYSGQLTYSAQHDFPIDEKFDLAFWPKLDFVGLAAYFSLAQGQDEPTVDQLKASWANFDRGEIEPLFGKVGKPIVFTELGYRSIDNAHQAPWDYNMGTAVDMEEQRRDYEALFSYWDTRSYMNGIQWWDWKSYPNAGGVNDRDYTPQNKPAQEVMRQWFKGEGPPDPYPDPTQTHCDRLNTGSFFTCFYNNATLTGSPTLTRTDTVLDFTWGTSPPATGVYADNFSIRSQGVFAFEAGEYEFRVAADDGVRLFADDELVIDKWFDQPTTEYVARKVLTSGLHVIKVEYYDRTWDAVIKTSWKNVTTNPPTQTQQCNNTGSNVFFTCYYGNAALQGAPVATAISPALDFDWAASVPIAGVSSDVFSLRTTGMFAFESGMYAFTVTADDGVRLFIDDQLVLDKWFDQPATTYTIERAMTSGTHVVRVEYYEGFGDAVLKLNWQKQAAPPAELSCNTTGNAVFFSCYYDNPNLTGNPLMTRTDDIIDFEWGGGSPSVEIAADNFSLRTAGRFGFESGMYAFTVTADDGVRLFIDDQLVLDKWFDQPATTYTVERAITSGTHVIKYEYYEHFGAAAARLSWGKLDEPPPASADCDEAGSGQFVTCFYSNLNMKGSPELVQTYPALAFNWVTESPGASIPNENFSARMRGDFHFDAGAYRFSVAADDGIRVFIDDQLVFDRWIDQAAVEQAFTRSMTAGKHRIRIEYYEKFGEASLRFNWTKT